MHMGWLQLVGSIKLKVSFVKETYKRDNILQKRHIILSILLTVATPSEETCERALQTTCCCCCTAVWQAGSTNNLLLLLCCFVAGCIRRIALVLGTSGTNRDAGLVHWVPGHK